MFENFPTFWALLAGAIDLVIRTATVGHCVLTKKDTNAAIAWSGIIWLLPIAGPILYVTLGINRIQRKAHILRRARATEVAPKSPSDEAARERLVRQCEHLRPLARLTRELTHAPLLYGNRMTPLVNGDEAYPEMLGAIEEATTSITLATYIFDNDRAGEQFREALARAIEREVEVRVLIDAVGSEYSRPPIIHSLRRDNVRVARFLPTLVPMRFRYTNLRNHRKIMVVDGRMGFTGGMNIREGHILALKSGEPVQDIHFKVEGPIVEQMQSVFAADWYFTTHEELRGEKWFPGVEAAGEVIAGGISDGPDENFDVLRLTCQGAITSAQSSIRIITPYFLPDDSLITALNVASMRGIEVDIVLPEQNNLLMVQWASTAMFAQLLERDCRLWLAPPPFDHSKAMIVDDLWTLIGSGNWDARSFRLNFEFNLECYHPQFAGEMKALFERKREASSRVTIEDVKNRRLPVRLRDGLARLLSPYL